MKTADLLAEIEDIIRLMPARAMLMRDTQENFSWLGRVVAAVARWSPDAGERARRCVEKLQAVMAADAQRGYLGLMVILNEARSDLRLETLGPINTAIGAWACFRLLR
jgi:hypothetical protein